MFEKLKERFTRYKPRDEKENLDFSGPPNPLELKEEPVKGNKRYHAYFDGYVERKVWSTKKQKEVIERIYVEDYYCRALTPKQRVLNTVLYYVLCIGGLMLFVWGSQQRIEAQTKFVYLPGAAVLVVEIILLCTLAIFSAAPAKLTIWDYRSGSLRLMRFSLTASCCMAAQAFVLLVYLLVIREGGSVFARVWCVAGNLLGAAANFGLYWFEKKAEYIRVENENSYLKEANDVHFIQS